jgi:hypothetical protein
MSVDRSEVADELADPKIKDGFKLIALEPLLVVEEVVDGVATDVSYLLKVAVSPGDGEPESVHIELTRDNDIYFVARCELDVESFETFKKAQRLKKGAALGPFVGETLKKTLENVVNNRTTFKAEYSAGKLSFKQQLEFKSVKIFDLQFVELPRDDEYVKVQAQFRYGIVQTNIRTQERKLKDLFRHIQNKDAALAQQFRKASKVAQSIGE